MTKIAIIEDDQAISQMYRFKFEAEGYSVETAENGKLGLELTEKMKPDIILLDLMMPEMTGDEMLTRLRCRLPGQKHQGDHPDQHGRAGNPRRPQGAGRQRLSS